MLAPDRGKPLTAFRNRLTKQEITPEDLRNNIAATYKGLRIGMAALGLLLPLFLGFGGYFLKDLSLQGSMSAYYYTGMRDFFVGGLWAIGAFLYLYKGYKFWENIFLNIAGLAAILVSIFPMESECGSACHPITIHGICAVTFFVCVAIVCIFHATYTLCLIDDANLRRRYTYAYRLAGVAMLAAPAIVYVLAVVLRYRETENYAVFYVEAVGVWVFSIFWIVKTIELTSTQADIKTVDRAVETRKDGLYKK